MSIYPDRKAGKLTGLYRIEVQSKGHRLKGRAKSVVEAKGVEKSLLTRIASGAFSEPKAARPTPSPHLTMKDALKRARGLLWAGQSTEMASHRKLERIAAVVGEGALVDAFDANSVDKVISSLKDGNASDSTINRYLSTISAFLAFCKRRDIRTTALPDMDWRDEDAGRIRWITYDEEERLLGCLPEPYSTIVYIAIRTGMRASELLGLKPDQLEPSWVHLWKTKNGGSRSVPLSPDLYTRLLSIIGTMPTYPQLRHQWDMARKSLGLLGDPTFVFHSTRHTFATRAVQAGVNIRVLQKLMGHKTIQTTLRYAHVDDRTLSDAALGALLFHDERGTKERGNITSNPTPPRTEGSISNERNQTLMAI